MNSGYDFLSSLSLSQLQTLLGSHPRTASAADPVKGDERIKQRELMARKRAAERDLAIPAPKNRKHRERALNDAEFFLGHYFGNVFYEPLTSDRLDMLQSIEDAALYGGDQAIAGPRGEGKTRIVLYQSVRLLLKGISRFPIVIGKSQTKSEKDLKTIREKFQQNKLFLDDFPEIGYPFKALGGWASRANMQTVAGEYTQIEMAKDHLIFPTIRPDQLEWGSDFELVSKGQIFACMGIDGPVRGTTYRDERPTLAIIDDVEDKQAARSDTLIAQIEAIIEEDIGGLGSSSEPIARVFLCTIQNRKCNAYKYTDIKQKPSWRGRRYRKMIKPPDRMDLVEQFIELWQNRKADDTDAREAYRFWRDNREAIEAGCIVSNQYSYSKKPHSDGEPMEVSAVHSYYIRVARYGAKAVATEIDNDPPEDAGPVGQGLTPEIVASRISGLPRCQIPPATIALTAAIDLGKYRCHWVVIAWQQGGTGLVVDYGEEAVFGTDKGMDTEATEAVLYQCLLDFRTKLLEKQFVDAAGDRRAVDFCMVDSGNFTQAAYQFCKDMNGIFHPSKGYSPYRHRDKNDTGVIVGYNLHAKKLPAHNVWLYELDTDYWKQFIHEGFLTPTLDDSGGFRRKSLSIFTPEGSRKHGYYAKHITAEELVSEFTENKGSKRYWRPSSPDNHWLDATYMAAAAGEVCGVKLIAPSEIEVQPRQTNADEPKPKKPVEQAYRHGQSRFKKRQGGWIPKRRG